MRYQISGKILYITSCVKNITFILTDEDSFYVIDNSKEKNIKKYLLCSTLEQKNKIKFQTKEIESQIWCHKLGSHAIIKYKNEIFYYNPNLLKEKVQELNFFYEDKYLQPYAIAFDDDYFEPNDTGEILFSDYNSDIYKLQITINGQNVVRVFGRIFTFKKELKNNKEENDLDDEFNDDFIINKNDRILDIKLLYSSKYNIFSGNKGSEGKNIIIMAITNNILFQFKGEDSLENVFENYSIDNGNILKGYKHFLGNEKINNFKFSKIQFINQYLLSSNDEIKTETKGILFGFMTKSGYCLGRLNNLFEYKPQNQFTVFTYVSNDNNNTNGDKKGKNGNNISSIIKVCQSINHIFFLYKERLVIVNKLTNRIIHIKYLTEKFNDMFYDEIQNGIFLYNGNHIYKIGLEHEYKYLWIDYVEIGNYELALKTVKNEDKKMKKKLHKLYAQYLFKEKKYLESAKEYAFSSENFESVCLKFLKVNNIKALIIYLGLVNYFRVFNRINSSDNKFIIRYLINTWLFELLIGIKENSKKNEITSTIKTFLRDEKHGNDFTNKTLLYHILKIYGRFEEFIEFGTIKEDYNEMILSLINYRTMKDALDYIKANILYGNDKLKELLEKIFFNYATLFIKQSPIDTIELIENYFKESNNQYNIEIIGLLNSIRILDIIKDEQKYKILINYIQRLIEKKYKPSSNELSLKKNTNLHNLYLLFLSYNNSKIYQEKLINYLKKPITAYYLDQNFKKNIPISNYIHFDLYFAKKIFEENPQALSLIYFLLSQYNESIELALKYNLKEIYELIAQKIKNPKLKKQLWLKIFNSRKKEGFLEAKQIVTESKGYLKIEDILPLMGDTVKIGEFKDELKECINNYEKSVQKLNKGMKEFNITTNLIQKDITNTKKRALNINYNKIRCHQCGNVIKEKKFFLFPCKHIFDMKCLIQKYIEYSKQGIGDQKFKSKVKAINDFVIKINFLNEKKNKGSDDAKSVGSNNSRRLPNFKALFRTETTVPKEIFTEEEENQLNIFNKGLYDFLDEECILCGKEIVQATQVPFAEENSLEWEII